MRCRRDRHESYSRKSTITAIRRIVVQVGAATSAAVAAGNVTLIAQSALRQDNGGSAGAAGASNQRGRSIGDICITATARRTVAPKNIGVGFDCQRTASNVDQDLAVAACNPCAVALTIINRVCVNALFALQAGVRLPVTYLQTAFAQRNGRQVTRLACHGPDGCAGLFKCFKADKLTGYRQGAVDVADQFQGVRGAVSQNAAIDGGTRRQF